MEWTTIEARWPEYRVAAKQQWGKLSEEQIAGTRGKREYLAKRVQEAYGMSSADTERQINDWQARQIDRPR
jgi:uncharacterized protein YjbJ (UPF0337 family)